MKKEDYMNKQGVCPKCGESQLRYDSIRYTDDLCWYPYRCEACGQQGEEWYRMEFQGHNVITEDGDVIEL